MTKSEWNASEDAGHMLDFLWAQEPFISIAQKFKNYPPKDNWENYLTLEKPIYSFYLASCRNIWQLLPQEESRKGIELAEQFIAGEILWEQVSEYNWNTEGAAFLIDYDTEPDLIAEWVKEVESIPDSSMAELLNLQENRERPEPRKLLLNAAYFADHAMIYPSITPKGPPSNHRQFMFASLLREYVDYPVAQ